jgi:hypothetical protein
MFHLDGFMIHEGTKDDGLEWGKIRAASGGPGEYTEIFGIVE